MLIVRDPATACGRAYDLIIVGGGMYGSMVALEAARRGLRPLLLERDDFVEVRSRLGERVVCCS